MVLARFTIAMVLKLVNTLNPKPYMFRFKLRSSRLRLWTGKSQGLGQWSESAKFCSRLITCQPADHHMPEIMLLMKK